MKRKISPALVLLVLIGCCSLAVAADPEATCAVSYVSAEHVYLDAGLQKGLAVGMAVKVVRDDQVIARLEVVYAAEHSASCRVLSQESEIRPGDRVVYSAPVIAVPYVAPEPAATAPVRPEPTVGVGTQVRHAVGPRLTGTIALQWDHSDAAGERDLTTDYLRLPFRLQVRDLGNHLSIRARGSLRRFLRSGYPGGVPSAEWRNRIQELAIVRDDADLDWRFAAGRVGGRLTGPAGPFDGLSVDRRLGGSFRLGALAGFAPSWDDLSLATEDQLIGLTGYLNSRSAGGNVLNLLLAGIGRYHDGDVSREYLTMTTTWRNTSGISLLQAAEVDLNRKWRKEAAGESATLSSLALTGRWQLGRRAALNLGYDDRKPVRTWEARAVPDSLFTDAGRQGWRAGLTLRDAARRSIDLWGSLRQPDNGAGNVYSWNGRLYLPDWPLSRLQLDAVVRGFSGPYLAGWSPMLGGAYVWRSGLRLRLEGGYYHYSSDLATNARDNSWLKLGLSHALTRRWSIAADYRHDWGDDIAGRRWFLELRHRF